MRCKKIYIKNIQRVREQEVYLDYPSVVIFGANKSGKSTLLNAISLALIGDGAREKGSAYGFVTRGCKENAVVELLIEKEQTFYKIRREFNREKRKSIANVFIVDEEENVLSQPASEKISEVNDYIKNNIVDPDIFQSILYANQFKLKSLIEMEPSKRKALLMEILNFGHLSKISQFFKDKALPVEKELSTQLVKISMLEETTSEEQAVTSDYRLYLKETNQLEKEKESLVQKENAVKDSVLYLETIIRDEEEKIRKILGAKETISTLSEEIEAQKKKREKYLQVLKEESRLVKLLEENKEIEKEIINLEEEENLLNKELEKAEKTNTRESKNLSLLEQKLEQFKSELNRLDTIPEVKEAGCYENGKINYPACPFFTYIKDDTERKGQLTKVIKEVEKDIAKGTKDNEKVLLKINKITNSISKIKEQVKNCKKKAKIEKINELRSEIMVAKEGVMIVEETIESKNKELIRKTEELRQMEQELSLPGEKLKNAKQELKSLQEQQEIILKEVKQKEQDLKEKHELLGAAKNALENIEQAKAQLSLIGEKSEAYKIYAKKCRTLEEIFGKNGIQPILIDQARPELEDIANSFFDKIDEPITIALKTQRKTMSKTKEEGLWIYIYDQDNFEDSFENYCGAERSFVSAVLYLTFLSYLKTRGQAPLFLVDEAFDYFDEGNKLKTMRLIAEMQNVAGQVIAVTHNPTVAPLFPHVITVENKEGETIYG